MTLPVVAIIGRPNVGKSSLFNALAGEMISIVEPTAGVTRDRVSTIIGRDEKYFELIDTGGYGIVDVQQLSEHIEQQIITAIESANIVLFMVDIREGIVGGEPTITPINHSTHVKSRVLSGSTWSAMNQATYGVGNMADSLRISELMYHPAADPNAEFIELKNIGAETINLNLVKFANGVDFTFPDIELASNGKIVIVRNTAAFNTAYPAFSGVIAGQYTGSLDNDGDRLLLQDAIGTVIHDFKFKDGWYDITDGGGFTLNVIDPANTAPSLYGDKDAWRASTNPGGSPGADDTGPNPGDIVINEVLAHADAWPSDWIELYNTSGSDINIGGWYLSDNNEDDPNLMKYRIADDTTITAGGYLVFTQEDHFGSTASDPGRLIPFGLSENGDKVCLSSAVGGQLTGYRETESFGASEIGISLGRYYKASTNSYNFVALSAPTPGPLTNPNPYYAGAVNAYPRVGPIVISEIMYHPPVGGSYDKEEYEYIELYNTTGSTVSLYDYGLDLGWTFTDGIDYTFAPGTIVAPYGRLVIARNIAAFAQRYGFSSGVLGPFENDTNLKNSGEQLQLGKPGGIDADGVRQYIRIDRVIYSDGTHPDGTEPDLWPTEPDGNGSSLTRKILTDYGNDPTNWESQTPSPGL